jgi:mRNA interferase RelE/StbE
MAASRYRIEFSHRAAKAYHALPEDVRRRIEPKIDALAEHPRPHGARKIEGEETAYRVRVGDYRILYEVHDRPLLILIMNVGHRREVYRRT